MATPDPTTSIRADRWVVRTRPCAHCGHEFTTKYAYQSEQQFCSRECGNEARRKGRERTCEACGAVFYAKASQPGRRFCRYECSATHHGTGTALYKVWTGIKDRCLNPRCRSYPNYGGRGITLVPEWRADFVPFRDWALRNGYAVGLSIDRIDNDGPYSPDNCRWTTMRQQTNNRRNTLTIAAFGETKSLSDWLRDDRCVVNTNTLRGRIRCGWAPEFALTKLADRKPDHAAPPVAGGAVGATGDGGG